MPCPEWQLINNNNNTMSESVRPEWLSQELDTGTQLLLMDCRAPNDYNASHIVGAIHVAIPSLMLRRLKKGKLTVSSVISGNESRDRFDRHCKTDTVVIYDERTSDLNANSTSVVSLLIRKLREDGCQVYLLEGRSISPVHTLARAPHYARPFSLPDERPSWRQPIFHPLSLSSHHFSQTLSVGYQTGSTI